MKAYNGDASLKKCAGACRECETVCLETAPHCLSKGVRHSEPAHILLLHNCARMCGTAAGFMVAGLGTHAEVCAACAQVCAACAADCESMADDEQVERCVAACRACEESCRRMAPQRRTEA